MGAQWPNPHTYSLPATGVLGPPGFPLSLPLVFRLLGRVLLGDVKLGDGVTDGIAPHKFPLYGQWAKSRRRGC